MAVLISGGAGYVGSHTCVELLNAGEDIIVFDNFFNSSSRTIDNIQQITGRKLKFYEADMLEIGSIDRIFDENEIEQVIHFAGYKSIPESVKHPLKYYSNNLRGAFNILETMRKYGCTKFIFSSTAVCENSENSGLLATNPYGSTKLIIENLCREMYNANKVWTFVLLRYLNTMGAHKSGLIGEDISGRSDSLMSAISAAALGKSAELQIAGNDYPTPDGTCVRDCVHVEDLAKGHVAAVRKARETESGCSAYNLGSGHGHSVKEIIDTFKRVNGVDFNVTFGSRRDGDVAECLCDPSLAEKELGWKAEQGLEDMCRDAWNFVKN
ncbi:MAG: UDP-glucose 4-epimerase GalE [Oscillospiraceae bacterium]|nr:UDP-glucose 4-epimerase GalE [Oscillospiraceae bacterium]